MKEQIEKLIDHYSNFLIRTKEVTDFTELKSIGYFYKIGLGICHCLTFRFNYHATDWVNDYHPTPTYQTAYWYRIPHMANNIEEYLDRVEWRLTYLKSIYEKNFAGIQSDL